MNTSLRVKQVIESSIRRANRQFNPSLNQSVEELSDTPSDRTGYDYAGTSLENKNNQ